MKVTEKTIKILELEPQEKSTIGKAYDIIWAIMNQLLVNYYDSWDIDADNIINDCDHAMEAIAKLASHFDSDAEFATWGKEEKADD